ncbi:hypothetical protein ACFOOM_12125 [Streptomyces echinoruber]|uniref:Uncharacterized protein n=1 Tax=Streptomyces echinoruber TaxID=68898 RepID=A0A918RLA6_9ACTN|nr:hypothetical protein [Streptomyces echinoruber]GHA01484.1 hypothetical protein GCM10010389_46070 [Streptomyces echinoruber]
MPALGTLVDDFDDGVRDPAKWPGSYGDVTEAGGRARVPCTTDYSAYASAPVYTLAGSQAACRMYAPAAGGAAVEALAEVLVLSSVGGTDAGFSLNAVTGVLHLIARTGYTDPNEVTLPYSPSTHAWVRLRETAGTLAWDTSADGATWTTRRTAPSPAWTADTNLVVILAGHRDSGTGDYCEFDNFNLLRKARLAATERTAPTLTHLARTGPGMSGG